ncbi:septum site determining protein, partial [Streptomyces sp. Mg1]
MAGSKSCEAPERVFVGGGGRPARAVGAGAAGGRPLIITEDPLLLDDLLRLCAAAGAEPHVRHAVPEQSGTGGTGGAGGVEEVRGGVGWESAPLVLVGDDAARRVRGAPRRDGVFLVARELDDPLVWQRAVEIGAEEVLRLRHAERRIVNRICDVKQGAVKSPLSMVCSFFCNGRFLFYNL